MNKKVVAVLTALMMCAVAAFIAAPASEDVEAETTSVTNANVSVVVDQSKDVKLFVNTSAFDSAAVVSVYTGAATDPDTLYSGLVTLAGYSYKIQGDQATGIYTVTVKGIAATASSDLYVKVSVSYLDRVQSQEFKISVTVSDKLSGVVVKNSGIVINTPSAAADWTKGTNVEPVKVTAQIGGSDVASGDYYYYAAGVLPAGVAMKSDGVISGAIPRDAIVADTYMITVFVTGKNTGYTQSFEVTINCKQSAAQLDFVYTVTVDGMVYSNISGADKVISSGGTIGVVQGTPATLTVNKTVRVTMVDPDGTILADDVSGSKVLETAGTGMYTVTMYDGPASYTFQLYVLGGIVVVADIYVTCS